MQQLIRSAAVYGGQQADSGSMQQKDNRLGMESRQVPKRYSVKVNAASDMQLEKVEEGKQEQQQQMNSQRSQVRMKFLSHNYTVDNTNMQSPQSKYQSQIYNSPLKDLEDDFNENAVDNLSRQIPQKVNESLEQQAKDSQKQESIPIFEDSDDQHEELELYAKDTPTGKHEAQDGEDDTSNMVFRLNSSVKYKVEILPEVDTDPYELMYQVTPLIIDTEGLSMPHQMSSDSAALAKTLMENQASSQQTNSLFKKPPTPQSKEESIPEHSVQIGDKAKQGIEEVKESQHSLRKHKTREIEPIPEEDESIDMSIADYTMVGGKKKKKKKKKKKNKHSLEHAPAQEQELPIIQEAVEEINIEHTHDVSDPLVFLHQVPQLNTFVPIEDVEEVKEYRMPSERTRKLSKMSQLQSKKSSMSNLSDILRNAGASVISSQPRIEPIYIQESPNDIASPDPVIATTVMESIIQESRGGSRRQSIITQTLRFSQQDMMRLSMDQQRQADQPSFTSERDLIQSVQHQSLKNVSILSKHSSHLDQQIIQENISERPQSSSIYQVQVLEQDPMQEDIVDNQNQSVVSMACDQHQEEFVKYYCRDCKLPLCPDCVVSHAKHDFIFADESAALEVKQQLHNLSTQMHGRHQQYSLVMQETDQKLQEIRELKKNEFMRIESIFQDLRRDLDQREAKLKLEYEEKAQIQIQAYSQDSQKITSMLDTIVSLQEQVSKFIAKLDSASNPAIVKQASKIKLISLEFQDYQHKVLQKEGQLSKFSVRDEALMQQISPQLHLNLSQAKKYIEHIGSYEEIVEEIIEANFADQEIQTDQPNYVEACISPLNQSVLDPLPPKIEAETNDLSMFNFPLKNDLIQQQLTQAYLNPADTSSMIMSNLNTDRIEEKVYWPRWDTMDMFRYDFDSKRWCLFVEARPLHKFLYFSSVVHMPSNEGMFILGGSDSEDNFSKRATMFSRYERFVEKAPMIYKRAFFPTLYFDSAIWVFGGHDGAVDTQCCERYDPQLNSWREVAQMKIKRNGSSAIAFTSCIFIFGGNNQESGSLDSIEKYILSQDTWELVPLKLQEPMHDTMAFLLSDTSQRVLIFGGNCDGQPNKNFHIYDLSTMINPIPQLEDKYGTKVYLPPVLIGGQLNYFVGYGDAQLHHQTVDLSLALKPGSNTQKVKLKPNGKQKHKVSQQSPQQKKKTGKQYNEVQITSGGQFDIRVNNPYPQSLQSLT